MSLGKVVIATCSAGEVETDYVQALWALSNYEYKNGREIDNLDYVTAVGGPRLSFHRNKIVKHFLETSNADWLLFVDSDMVFPPDALSRLLELHDEMGARVLGGLCFGGGYGGDVRPTMYNIDESENMVKFVLDWEIDSVLNVDITGAAFLLIHADVLSEMYDEHGSDAIRIAATNAIEGIDDGNYEMSFIDTAKRKLFDFFEFAKENYNKGRENELYIDRWFSSAINECIAKTTQNFEGMLFKSGVQSGFLDMQRHLKWYIRRKSSSSNA